MESDQKGTDTSNRSRVIAKYDGQPILNGGIEDLQMIEQLYASDREEEAIQLIDSVLGLPEGLDRKLASLKYLMAGKEDYLQVFKPVGDPKNPSFEIYLKLGGAFTRFLMLHRSKCFAAIADKSEKIMDQAMENSEIVLTLFPADNDIVALAAQVIFHKGEDDRAFKILREALEREPEHPHVKKTLRWLERGRDAESFITMTDRAYQMAVDQLEKLTKDEPVEEKVLHQALDLSLESLRITENQPKAWASLAFLYSLANDRERTLTALKYAQNYDPSERLAEIVAKNCEKRGWFGQSFEAIPSEGSATADWTTSGGDARRTGRCGVAVVPPLALAWVSDQCGPIGGGIVGSGVTAVFGGANNKVFAVNVRNGRTLWEYSLGLPVGTPAVDSGRIYAGSSDGAVCLDMQTGREIWKYQRTERKNTFGLGEGCILATSDLVVLSDDRTLVLQIRNGKPLMEIETGYDASYHAGACGDGTYIYVPGSKRVYRLEIRTREVTQCELGVKLTSGPIIANERLLFGTNQGSVVGISTTTLERWVTEIDEPMEMVYSRPAFSDGRVFVGSPNGNVYALDPLNGHAIWKTEIGGYISGGLLVSDSVLYVLSDHNLSALSIESGEVLWQSEQTRRGGNSAPAILGGRLLVGCERLYAYKSLT